MFTEQATVQSKPSRRGGGRPRNEGLRASIVEAARGLAFAGGAGSVTARRLAEAAGCSSGAIYLHFDSIEHVLHELRMEGHALLTRYLELPSADLDAVERLCRMQREYQRFGVENPNHFRLMFGRPVEADAPADLSAAEARSLGVVERAAELGIEKGELARDLDPMVVANVTWMSVHGLTSMTVSGHAAVTAAGRTTEVLEGIVRATRAWLGSK